MNILSRDAILVWELSVMYVVRRIILDWTLRDFELMSFVMDIN